MSQTSRIAAMTFLKLRRDRIFLPAVVCGAVGIAFAVLVSFWSIEEIRKLLFDFGTVGFLLLGVMVALFWGTKVINDARKDGSIEIILATPVSRLSWLCGNYLGLALALLLLAALLLAVWQVILFGFGLSMMTSQEWIACGFIVLLWLVVAALSACFATLASSAVALFCSLVLCVSGFLAAPVLQTLSPEVPESTRRLVEGIATVWNLKQFSFAETVAVGTFPSTAELGWRIGYGLSLIVVLLLASVLMFRQQDLTP